MKYKKGGSPLQPLQQTQQTTTNIVNPPESSNSAISDNTKYAYLTFKVYMREFKQYFKSHYIIILLACVLLIFYITLLLQDPLTEEDVQGPVETITCEKGWKGGCPNKTFAGSRECVDNECTEETCCVNELDCSDWDGQCGINLNNKGTDTCFPNIDGNCSDKCCAMTCSQFLNSSCPNNYIKNADNFCSKSEGSDEYVCSYGDCCDEQITCTTFSCPSGQILSDSAASIECINNECNPIRCCNDEPTEEDSSSEAARATEALRVASTIEAASSAAADAEAASMATQQALDVLGSGSTAVAGSDTSGG
jgi:hypothetical protein